MKKELHFFTQLPMAKRRDIRKLIDKTTESRKEQRKLFMENVVNPITEQINLSKEVLSGQLAIEHYIKRNERLAKHINGLLKGVQK